MRYLILTLAALSAYAVNASAREIEVMPQGNECRIILAGRALLNNKDILSATTFKSGPEEEMLPQVRTEEGEPYADLGRITQVKDYDRVSQGRIVVTTNKGAVISVSPYNDSVQRYTGRNDQNAPLGRV